VEQEIVKMEHGIMKSGTRSCEKLNKDCNKVEKVIVKSGRRNCVSGTRNCENWKTEL
jgi:hypothetical protein